MSFVYFVHAPSVNLVKIGRSVDPERRFSELRLLSPVDLKVIGVVNGGSLVEAQFHRQFDHLHSHGEWFHATKELMHFAWWESLKHLWEAAPDEWRERAHDVLYPDVAVMDRGAA
ncbi:GIY-YIG nuclease family protein [Methylobacterium sp. 1973]|uniref:GIY-YIG nuclease family protein n=1 Tax=Methylobacterium sp. 1973 TaxID=3156421 RepID=UPI0033928730